MLDPMTALQTYRSSCQAKAHGIERFVAGRDGFDLSRHEAELLDDKVGIMVEQVEAMEELWDDVVHKYPVDINNDTLVTEWSGWPISSTQSWEVKLVSVCFIPRPALCFSFFGLKTYLVYFPVLI